MNVNALKPALWFGAALLALSSTPRAAAASRYTVDLPVHRRRIADSARRDRDDLRRPWCGIGAPSTMLHAHEARWCGRQRTGSAERGPGALREQVPLGAHCRGHRVVGHQRGRDCPTSDGPRRPRRAPHRGRAHSARRALAAAAHDTSGRTGPRTRRGPVKYGAGELEEAFAELLGDLVRVLDRVGAPWMLIGGLAVGAWTEPRGTKDCDLAIAIPEDVEQLAGALSEIGLVVFAGDLERAREGGAVRLRAERAAGPPPRRRPALRRHRVRDRGAPAENHRDGPRGHAPCRVCGPLARLQAHRRAPSGSRRHRQARALWQSARRRTQRAPLGARVGRRDPARCGARNSPPLRGVVQRRHHQRG